MAFMIVGKRGRVTLPVEVRRALGLGSTEAGLVILEKTDRGTYELVPAALLPRDQIWFHAPEMDQRMEVAEAEFRAGQSTRTDTPEAAQAFLDSLKR